jgi:predicted DsbA family dithiol-disulfide isomerase
MIEVSPGTIAVYTDVACPWSTVALSRLYAARRRLGLDGAVHVDHRLFALELENAAPVPKRTVDAEVPVLAPLAPDVGWRAWDAEPSTWPVSSLPANEAVHVAKRQGLTAAEELDFALRRAFFGESRCITMRDQLLDVARSCPRVDAGAIATGLDRGTARADMMATYLADRERVQTSPHLFFADGSDEANPGIDKHWSGGEEGEGSPVIDRDDVEVWDELLRRAVTGSGVRAAADR